MTVRSGDTVGKSTTTVEVEIFGACYHVRGDDDSSHLQELAALVDGKMREVAEHVGAVDTGKVAILAALNIADELSRVRKQLATERESAVVKTKNLIGELSQALTS